MVTDATPHIRALLGRNIGAGAILDAASRLREDPAATNVLSAMGLAVGTGAPPEVRAALAEQLRRVLASAVLDAEHLTWILAASSIPAAEAQAIAKTLAALRLNVLDGSPEPYGLPPDVWVTITGPDVLVDLLFQPLNVFATFVRAVFTTWQGALDAGARTYWENKLPDEATTSIELFILRGWGVPVAPFAALETGEGAAKRVIEGLDLEPVDSVDDLPWERNPDPFVNQSAFVSVPARESGGLADRFYGHVFSNDFWEAVDAPYRPRRRMEPLPPYGVLSVPFREIPRLYASSADELLAMCSSIARHVSKQGTGVNRILFRGQTREYTLPRDKTTLKALYGRDDVIEPSLVPSASRRPPSSATQMAFASVLELASVSPAAQQATWRSILGDRQKVAFAQHYGLATDALDLTEDVKVALWFALTRLDAATENDFVASPVDEDNVSVLYLFRVGEFDARAIDVVDSPSSRPALQRGWVSSGSWGWRANRAATRLEAAIYFPGSVRNALALPATTELFRPPTDEPVTRIAQELLERLPESVVGAELARALYSIVT